VWGVPNIYSSYELNNISNLYSFTPLISIAPMMYPCLKQGTLVNVPYDVLLRAIDSLRFIPPSYTGSFYFDPNISYYFSLLLEAIAARIVEQANLENWIKICQVCEIPLFEGVGYLDLDIFWTAAVAKVVDEHIREQNKKQEEVMKGLEKKLIKEDIPTSNFNHIPMPKNYGL